MSSLIKRFVREDDGATMVEYGLMVALIAIVCILVIAALGVNVGEKFDEVNTAVVNSSSSQVPVTNP
jgi:pilus assembly protein Flp/PilA